MLRKQFFKKNLIFTLSFTLGLALVSCGGSDDNNSGSGDDTPVVDTKPVAEDDLLTVTINSSSGTSNQITVSGNDNLGDDGGDSDNYSLSEDAKNGKVTEISDGVFEYIPNTDYEGTDSFIYTITDKDGDTDTATVNLDVVAGRFDNIDPNNPSFVSVDNTTPSDKQWVKVESMSDEFDAWDSSKWEKSTWPYGPPVFMSTSSNNSGVSDGNLWIRSSLRDDSSDPADEKRWFQAARVHSRTEINYPMYTEARIKTSHISAYNTYWLNNGDSDNRDEIDIIENNSNPSCTGCTADVFPTQMNSQYFQADDSKTPKTVREHGNFSRLDLSDDNPLKNVGWNEDYHTYGVWWKDSKNIQFYLNGEPAGSVVVGEHQDGNTYDREFTRDLEIIFDLWTNEAGWLGGLPTKSEIQDNSINTMRIDWVRTWKLEDK